MEQFDYRELLYQMTRRDLMLRYKQTVIGFGWALFMPLVNTAIFSMIFMRVAPIDSEMPYPLFAYSGLLSWNFSASAFRFAVGSLTSNANLVTKVYFPREIFPISAVIVSLVDFGVGAIVLAAMMAYYHVALTTALLALPLVIVVHVAFTVAVSLMLAMANLFYRDVKYLFEIVISIWMFATSVVYPVSLLGGKLGALLSLNPMTPILDTYRDVLIRGRVPGPAFGIAAVTTALLIVVVCLVFHRAEYQFAENI